MNLLRYFLIFSIFIWMSAWAQATSSVPHRFHFQSVFYDSGGNPLASGSYTAKLAILDQSDQVVYSEEQQVELANGVVSIMVGDGFKEGTNLMDPTGGIPPGALTPDQTHYLKVEINGETHQSPLEIVSVPYSYFCEESLSVSPGSILAESLARGIIERDHLSQALQEAIFGTISSDRLPGTVVSKQEFTNHTNAQANAHAAEAISVPRPAFANSNSTNVAGVLKDLDVAVEFQKHNISAKVSKTGDVMSGNLQMQGANITLSEGATVDGYDISSAFPNLQSQINTKLPLSGGSMSGILDMNGNKIINVEQPQGEWDAATKSYVDWRVSTIQAELLARLTPSPSQSVGPPQVVAAGVVDRENAAFSLRGGSYNVDHIDPNATTNPGQITIYFQNPIPAPYFVLITPAQSTIAQLYSVFPTLYVDYLTDSSFQVRSSFEYKFVTPFHFVVFK